MGQRHQLFVIAKINGRYRTLCAIHHQWLYGQTALRRCLGTLKIFQDPANRIPIQQELIAAGRHDEAFWTATNKEYYKKNSHVPFPFIATCLITGASFGPQEGYYHGVIVEPFYMAYNEGDNNNGITVFDITDPSSVRYCFVDFYGMESERSVQLMTPLAARTYLEAYYDLSDHENSRVMIPLLDEFNTWDVISVETLQDTWPEGEWEDPESDLAVADDVSTPELENLEISTPQTSKTLREGAMVTMLQALLDGSDEDSDLLSEAELLTDFLPKLKEKLYERSNALKPSSHILDLLCRALQEEIDVDLSPFTAFSPEDMSLVVSRLREHGKMNTLCISNRSDLTTKDLQIVLREAVGLKALYLLEDPQITVRGTGPLLKECELYNSALLRQAIKPEPVRSLSDPPIVDDDVLVTQVCEDNDISQLVWIGVSDQQALDQSHRLQSGQFKWETLRQEKRRTNFGWSGHGLRYKRYPFDVPFSTSRTVAGLLCLFQWSSASQLYDVEQFSRGTALSFASGLSFQGDKNNRISPSGSGIGLGLGALSPGLYRDSSYHYDPTDDAPTDGAHEHLESGKWAVVLIHEAYNAASQKFLDRRQRERYAGADSDSEDDNPLGQAKGGEGSLGGMMALLMGPRDPFENKGKNQGLPFRAIKRLRYALVTPSTEPQVSGHEFVVADIPSYLEQTMGETHNEAVDGGLKKKLIDSYNSGIAAMDTVDFYREEDIHEILLKVFPKQKPASSGSKQ